MMRTFAAACVVLSVCAVSAAWAQQSISVVEYSRINAAIVTADQPAGDTLQAAAVLHSNFLEMSREIVPILTVSAFEKQDRIKNAILVGPSRLTDAMGVSVEQREDDGDHIVIRTAADKPYVAVVGNDGGELRGTVLAAYQLLWELGCGWYAPDPKWQVIPNAQQIGIPVMNVDKRPAFKHRNIWMVTDRPLQDALGLGGTPFGHGHSNMGVPHEWREQHPEWFGPGQPMLTNPDLIKAVAEHMRKQIDERYDGAIISFSICANDGVGYDPRDLAKGNVSSATLQYANALARELNKTHAGKFRLAFYAYWYSHDAPEPTFKAEPGVAVMQVNEGDHLKPWDMPEDPALAATLGRSNTRETEAFKVWHATGAEMAIYEWWIPNVGDSAWRFIPWYPFDTSLRNYRYWRDHGVTAVSHESKNDDPMLRWPLYFVGARGMWQPDLTVEEILKPACRRLFGEQAGDHMYAFYTTFEKATLAAKATGWNWYLPSPEQVYTAEYVNEADVHLKAALAAAPRDPAIEARLAQEKDRWEQASVVIRMLAYNPTPRYNEVSVDGRRMWTRDLNVRGDFLHNLFGFNEHAPLYAINPDGTKRRVAMDDPIDLRIQSKFSLVAPE